MAYTKEPWKRRRATPTFAEPNANPDRRQQQLRRHVGQRERQDRTVSIRTRPQRVFDHRRHMRPNDQVERRAAWTKAKQKR